MVRVQMEWVEVSPETEWVQELAEVDHMLTVQEKMENRTEVNPMVDSLVVEGDNKKEEIPTMIMQRALRVKVVEELFVLSGVGVGLFQVLE